jgi:hypothetical protein
MTVAKMNVPRSVIIADVLPLGSARDRARRHVGRDEAIES